MNEQEVMEYIDELKRFGVVPGLANMERLCEKLGNPQDQLKFIHIAGTNGKGSVLSFCSEILKESGYRVGRYISPTIFEYRERIQVNGRLISKKALCQLMGRLKELCDELVAEGKPHPTAFEVETAMAFWYFQEQKCDIVVLETGMGGRLDATNVIPNTVLTIFTSISYDHMGVLGHSLTEIAKEKAGIMKKGSVAVALKGEEEVMEVLKSRAEELSVPFVIADPSDAKGVKHSLAGQRFHYGKYRDLAITLAGVYQVENAVLAVRAMEELQRAGFAVKEKAIYQDFLKAKWPGRFQVLLKKPIFIADGAHNRDGAAKLAQSIRFYFTNKRIIYIIGMLRDKEQDEILKTTCPMADQVLTVPTKGERGLSSYELACVAGNYHKQVTALDSVQEAVELSLLMADQDTVIIAFGSLSYLGNLIKIVETVSDKRAGKTLGETYMVNKEKVEAAIKMLLEGIGEDCNREGLRETPARVARMYEELLSGMDASPKEHLSKTFTTADNQIVLEKDITFHSICEHHLMPFFGKVHIAYIPDGKVVGISKLARTVEVFAARLQIQERLTVEIADAIMENLCPKGVIVMAQAEHMCMTMRGVKKPGSQTVTVVSRGVFEQEEGLRTLFFNLINQK